MHERTTHTQWLLSTKYILSKIMFLKRLFEERFRWDTTNKKSEAIPIVFTKNRSAQRTYVGVAFFLLFWTLHVKARFQPKAVFTSLNVAFVPISRSRFKQHQIPPFRTFTWNVLQFCINFWGIFGHSLNEIFSKRIG